MAIAAAQVREARAMAGYRVGRVVQINSDTTLKRHNWPNDQFWPGALSGSNTWDNNTSLGFNYALDLWGRESNATERAVDLAHMSAAEATGLSWNCRTTWYAPISSCRCTTPTAISSRRRWPSNSRFSTWPISA